MTRVETIWAAAGIAVGVLFAGLAAAGASRTVTLWIAIAIVVIGCGLFLYLYGPWIKDHWKRRRFRQDHHIERLRVNDEDKSPYGLTGDAYGFEVISSVEGLRQTDPRADNGARLKRSRGGELTTDSFPLEVHWRADSVFLVGYLCDEDRHALESRQAKRIVLWMQARGKARSLAAVPLGHFDGHTSRGLGTRKSPWKLFLDVLPETSQASSSDHG